MLKYTFLIFLTILGHSPHALGDLMRRYLLSSDGYGQSLDGKTREDLRNIAPLAAATTVVVDREQWESSQSSHGQYCPEAVPAYQDYRPIGRCSGFLIAEDIVVTAGHCINDLKACEESSFLFGYDAEGGKNPKDLDHYRCRELIRTESAHGPEADFAFVLLDRPVLGVKPLALARASIPSKDRSYALLGYPLGYPLSVTEGVDFKFLMGEKQAVVMADASFGHSGSPIIDETTKEVVFMLVRGSNRQLVKDERGCFVERECEPGLEACGVGENVMRGSYLAGVWEEIQWFLRLEAE